MIKNCRVSKGGCGKDFKTDQKRAKKCSVCKEKSKLKLIRKNNRNNKKLAKLMEEFEFITCGICGVTYKASSINSHMALTHFKDYLKLKRNYYEMIENLEETK